ncbi:hypothetical protein Pcinc_031908 [Petrolisthes cinctipes]|uniref:Direct IAP-binding protein with low pI n=1 Tax=Petrolisthes cinctipes TaxID=88211 RepID=A0AAE1K1W9_PETCI|nr:hypothetical protein Pcinc_031908 [Petrolisthes cinctipes]
MDTTEGDISKESLKPLEMNEVAALTHTSLLRQASAVAVDAALQLLHRTLRASVDFSAQYRKQLNEVIDLMEFCTVTIRNAGQHDSMWELLVAARSHADSLKQQLRDLNIMMGYAYVVLENAGMTAYMNGVESTATAAQQAITNAKHELEQEAQMNHALEIQYVYAHTCYIKATQQLDEEQEMIENITTTPNDGFTEGETDHQEASTC